MGEVAWEEVAWAAVVWAVAVRVVEGVEEGEVEDSQGVLVELLAPHQE